jgi:ribulose-5-phosphate 4-epimerase/fuculose-1-phosphate aldolase
MAISTGNESETTDAWRARVDLAAMLRIAVHLDLHEGVDNHFSLLVPGRSDRFLINPDRRHWSEVKASDIVEVDLNGTPVDGKKPPEATALNIHSSIHQRCPQATCILHAHTRFATALTMLDGVRVEPAVQGAMKFYGQIAYDDVFGGLALDASEGDRGAAALGDRRILFMANHGVTVVGPSIAHAFNDLYYLERVCRAQITAMSSGAPLKRIPQDVAQHTHEQMQADRDDQATQHFAAMKRILDREGADYAS